MCKLIWDQRGMDHFMPAPFKGTRYAEHSVIRFLQRPFPTNAASGTFALAPVVGTTASYVSLYRLELTTVFCLQKTVLEAITVCSCQDQYGMKHCHISSFAKCTMCELQPTSASGVCRGLSWRESLCVRAKQCMTTMAWSISTTPVRRKADA